MSQYDNSVARWAGLGPYYAMFPTDFAFRVVQRYCAPGEWVLDPFCGRGSSIFAATASDRQGFGVEISPVGWLYGHVKLKPGSQGRVLSRLSELVQTVADQGAAPDAPEASDEFYNLCFAPQVLSFLQAARHHLRWRTNRTDATLMSLILVYLHGKAGSALSNQMRQSKAMSPDYCVRWWREHGATPPRIDVERFLAQRIRWRYAKGLPPAGQSEIVLGDSVTELSQLVADAPATGPRRFSLLFTSPPYCGVTNYHYDQWLRLWVLGGHPRPARQDGASRGRFWSREDYRTLLEAVFGHCARALDRKATVYVRTDAREFTLGTTVDVLRDLFPRKTLQVEGRPLAKHTQTALFGDRSEKPGEVDLVLV